MISYPFDSQITGYADDGAPIYDRAADSSVLRRWMAQYFTDGVFHGSDSMGMQVMPGAGLTISITPGAVSIQGAIGIEDNIREFVLEAANTNPRIDTVVARLNLETDVRSVDLYVLTGSPAINPVRPSLTRNLSIWELGLADIHIKAGVSQLTISEIDDTRYDQDRCGAVACPLSQIDTSVMLEQWNAKLAELEQLLLDVPNGTTLNALRLNGKDPSYYTPWRMVGDNLDFRHFVAQAGIGGNHGSQAYAGDRWMLISGTVSGTKNTNGDGYSNITLNGKISQIIPDAPEVLTVFVGMISGTATANYADGELTITSYGGVIDWVMPLEGEVNTQPPFIPRGYASELAECKRHFRRISAMTVCPYASVVTGNSIRLGVNLGTMDLRIKPTITMSSGFLMVVRLGTGGYSNATGSAGVKPKTIYNVFFDANALGAYFEFDDAIATNNMAVSATIVDGYLDICADPSAEL